MSLDLSLTPETAALADALRLVPHGETISYSELSTVIGRDVVRQARSRLVTALRIVLRDDGVAFEAIRRVGLRRLFADEAPDLGRAARRKIRRSSRRAVSSMQSMAAASNGLSPIASRRLSAEFSTLGLIAELSTDRSVAAQPEKFAPPAKAAAAFLQHIGVVKTPDVDPETGRTAE